MIMTTNTVIQKLPDFSPKSEIINFLFSVNLHEDMTQELRSLYSITDFPKINKIFQTVKNIDSICEIFS